MSYCPGCGSRIEYSSDRCANCGAHLRSTSAPSSPFYQEGLSGEEKAGICIGNICLSPLLGVILYFVWKDDKPKKAEDVCSVTIFAVVAGVVLSFLFAILGAQ